MIFAWSDGKILPSMGKKVIVIQSSGGGESGVFRTLGEASAVLGVSESSLSRAIRDSRELNGCLCRYVDRVFAVRERGSSAWLVVGENSRGSGYIELGNPLHRIAGRDVEQVRELTAVWYIIKE